MIISIGQARGVFYRHLKLCYCSIQQEVSGDPYRGVYGEEVYVMLILSRDLAMIFVWVELSAQRSQMPRDLMQHSRAKSYTPSLNSQPQALRGGPKSLQFRA